MMLGVVSDAAPRDSERVTAGAGAGDEVSLEDSPLLAPIVKGAGLEVARLRLRDRLFGERNDPARVGRYVVLRLLGEGGMGVVFAAHDPELDRRVAVKVMRAGNDTSGLANARLVREAQSIAQVSDPNVIAVYEVGVDADRVYIAMEHIEGVTLRAWLRERPRPWPEVLATVMQAGRGLAAGHAANVVHRDFKPENAMLGVDGRVRVLDFGLARSGEERVPDPALASIDDDQAATVLTPAGVAVGTPAYMAPEQFTGARADAASDQFSFCVTLFEALYGQRPFAGRTVAALRVAVRDGELVATPKSDVPLRLRAIILRGLSAEPSRRWPSMRALLDALERVEGRRRALRTSAAVVLAAAALAAGSLTLAWNGGVGPEVAACTAGAERSSRAWSEHRREQVGQAFAVAAPEFGAAEFATAEAGLTRYLEGWDAAYATACNGADRSTPEGQTRLDLEMACLDARLAEVRALVEVWTQADAAAVRRAAVAIDGLEPVSRCAEVDVASAPPAHLAAALSSVTDELARAKALRAAGRFVDGLAQVTELVPRAQALGHVPTAIETSRMLGLLQHDLGDYAAAEASAERAYDEARAARQDRAAFEAALELVTILGDRRSRPDEAFRWARHAEAVLDAGPPNPEARGRLLAQTGLVRYHAGDPERSLVEQREALTLLEEAGADARILVAAHGNLGMVLRGIERTDEALEHYRQALEILAASMPPDSIHLAHILDGRAGVLFDRGHLAEAERDYRHALVIRERFLGPEHSFVAVTCSGLGSTLVALGRLDEGLTYHARAVRITEAAMGPDHPLTVVAITNLAGVYIARQEYDRALSLAVRAQAATERTLGPTHPDMIAMLNNLVYLEDALGHYDRVLELLLRLRELQRLNLGATHPSVIATEAEIARFRAMLAK
jgi:tetratricopeptide (TPR) repeat protein